jgi:hypothetical protein
MSIVQCSIMNVPCLGLPNRRITNHLRILDIHESRIANQLPQKTPSLDRPSSSSPPVSCISSFHAWVCILPTSTIHIPSADVETSHFNYPHQSAHWRSNVKTKQSTNTTDDLSSRLQSQTHPSVNWNNCLTDTGFIQFTHIQPRVAIKVYPFPIAQTLRIYKQDPSSSTLLSHPPRKPVVIHPQNKANETHIRNCPQGGHQ